MKSQISYYLQFSLMSSLFGNSGSPLIIYEQLLASGHIEKAIQAPIGGFSVPSGMAIHHDIGDAKMHESAVLLRIMFDQMAAKFYKAVVFDGSDLLNHYKTILLVTSVSELNVISMTRTLRGAKRTFKGVEDNMRALQWEVHSLIESVRGRIRDLKSDIIDKENNRQIMELKIENMEQEMREDKRRSDDYDRQSRESANAARRNEKESEEAANWGAAQIVGAFGTLAIGYATGGLAYAVAPGVLLGGFGLKNTNDAADLWSRSKEYRYDAIRYARKAEELQSNIRQTRTSVSQLKLDTEQIKHLLFRFESSLTNINAFSNSLHNSVEATYQVISMLQNMEVAVKNAEIDTESLLLRFKQAPLVFKKAESTLKTTQTAWETIQELLKMHYKLLT